MAESLAGSSPQGHKEGTRRALENVTAQVPSGDDGLLKAHLCRQDYPVNVGRWGQLEEISSVCKSLGQSVFPGDSQAKTLPANAGGVVQSLGQKYPLEKEMATHSGFLTWETPWIEEPGGLESAGSQTVSHDLETRQQQVRLVSSRSPVTCVNSLSTCPLFQGKLVSGTS